jgi:oleate hydratase
MEWLEQKSELGDLLRDYGWIGNLDDPDLMTVAVRKSPPRGKTVL